MYSARASTVPSPSVGGDALANVLADLPVKVDKRRIDRDEGARTCGGDKAEHNVEVGLQRDRCRPGVGLEPTCERFGRLFLRGGFVLLPCSRYSIAKAVGRVI
jgi:hypothetical protein